MRETGVVGSLTREERDDLVRNLHVQQGGRCFISGEPIDLSQHEVELDHITAFARGGPDNEANLALSGSPQSLQGPARSRVAAAAFRVQPGPPAAREVQPEEPLVHGRPCA